MIQSNRTVYFFAKYGLLIGGLGISILPLTRLLISDQTFTGIFGLIDNFMSFFVIIVGLIYVIIYFNIKDNFSVIKMGRDYLTIDNGKETRELTWDNIDFIKKYPIGPLYRLKLKDSDRKIWFNNERPLEISGLFTDTSQMGQLIFEKKVLPEFRNMT